MPSPKILIFGNSGSGKSTLARQLAEEHTIGHLDLDTIAWRPGIPPERAPLEESEGQIRAFTDSHPGWVIEGCYSDLLERAAARADRLIYLNLPVSLCIENARQRPWEPHKYASKALQDENLAMLLEWIADYETREDTFSRRAHTQLFETFEGEKTMYLDNGREG